MLLAPPPAEPADALTPITIRVLKPETLQHSTGRLAAVLIIFSTAFFALAAGAWLSSGRFDANPTSSALALMAGAAICGILAAASALRRSIKTGTRLAQQADQTNQARQLLTEAVATSPDGFIVFDSNDVIVLRNDAVDRVYGKFAEVIKVGNSFSDIIEHGLKQNLFRNTDSDPSACRQFLADRLAQHHSGESEFMYHGTDDRWLRIVERRSDSGYIVSVATELTRIKHTEAALRESEARFRGILEDHNEFIVRFNPNLEISYANPAYAAHLGKTQSELIHSRLSDSITSTAVADLETAMRSLCKGTPNGSRELSVQGPDGQTRWESWALRGYFDQEGQATEYQAVGRDMSKEKVASDALHNSARLFRSIAESHPIPVLLGRVDDNKLVYANEVSVPLLGASIEEILSTTADKYFADGLTYQRFDAIMREHRAAKSFPAMIRTPDGRLINAELNARLTRYDDEVVVAVSITDTSEIIRTQEQLARQRLALAQSEKLSALGSLLASVSHELNNPLAIVVGQSQLLETVAKDKDTRERAQKIGNAAKRSARIVRTFLSMVRQRPPSRTSVDLNDTISKSLEIASYGLKASGIELVLDLNKELPLIQADEDQLIQVVVNLMINAQHAMQDHDGQRKLNVTTRSLGRQQVRLSVADSGPGIEPENRNKIFDAFYTTKADGIGTGIGLSVSSGIVRSHAGKIRALDSEYGGALFEVDLPIQSGSLAEVDTSTDMEAKPAIGKAHILIIDDEPEITATISEILKLDGYETKAVPDGEQALTMLETNQFDLIITDLWMPGIDGPAIVRELESRKIHPTSRIIFITGDSLSPAAIDFLDQCRQPVIEKPFHPDEVRAHVRELLSKSSV
ncbi:MAG: PAS domain S-box protein [Burkholderiaceae bacterium]